MFSSSPLSAPPPLVVDWGAYSLRVGIAGDALPRCLLPAVVGLPHPQLCCSTNGAGSNGSSGSRRSKWRGGLSSNCRLLGSGASTAGPAGYGSAAAFMCPLNPLQKRDHVDVYPVVVYEHPSFALAAAAAAGACRVKKQQGDACSSTGDWLADAAAADADGGEGDEEEDSGSTRAGGFRERREHAAFSAAAGSSCALPGGYHVEMNGFESLIEAACGPDALDEGSLEGRAVLLSEPNAMDRPLRDAYAELMFETFKTSQLFLGKKAALACFGCARTSSVVVDVGHSHASACGVQEGYVLQKSIREVPFAGQQLSILSRLSLGRSGIPLTPGYAVTRVPLAAADAEAEGGEDMWGGNSSGGGLNDAALLPACKKSHYSSKGGNNLSLSLVTGGSRSLTAAGAASAAVAGRAAGAVKGETTTRVGGEKAGAAGAAAGGAGTGISCSTDRRYREAVEVGACPHVTSSYRAWGCFHLAEVLAQVLGECHPTAAAARKQQQEQLLCKQQQWAAAAASGGAASHHQQQRSCGGGRRRGGGAGGGQQQLWRAAAAGRGKGEEDSSASEMQAEEKQPLTTVGRRGGARRRSSGTSSGAAGERKRGSSGSAAARLHGSSGSSSPGGAAAAADDEEPPYVLPDGTAVDADTVNLVREGVAEALFNVPLRLRVFTEVWAGSSSKTAAAAAGSSTAAAAAAFLDSWRCCGPGGATSSTVNSGRSLASSAAATATAVAAAAGVGGSGSSSGPLWSAYEAAATGATYPRFLSRVSLSDLIKSTLSSCGRGAARRDVTATIIPTGGGSLYPGFISRFKAELRALAEDSSVGPLLTQHSNLAGAGGGWGSSSSSSEAAAALLSVSQPLRVVASRVDVERRFASWIGGSILSCLGSFSQFAVTKEEYEEYGARVAIGRKCP